jgi:hypothetical protein
MPTRLKIRMNATRTGTDFVQSGNCACVAGSGACERNPKYATMMAAMKTHRMRMNLPCVLR